jgi:hypothetical protein
MATEGTNLDRLEAVGLIFDRENLPEDHEAVVEALTNDEVDILESIKERLDAADKLRGLEPGPGGRPAFTTWVIF